MNTRLASILVAALPIVVLLTSPGCRGGGDSDWLFPLWIETDVWVGDIDRDARAHILTLASYSTGIGQQEGRLMVRRQTTPGVFASAQTYSFGIYPSKMAIGDIDGDGAVDLVVTDVGRTDSLDRIEEAVWMLLQDAAMPGVFLPPQRLPLERTQRGPWIGALDTDAGSDTQSTQVQVSRPVSSISVMLAEWPSSWHWIRHGFGGPRLPIDH